MKTVSVLGSTGSIGQSTVDLLRGGDYHVKALTAHRNVGLLAEQAKLLGAEYAVIANEELYGELKAALAGTNVKVEAGAQAVVDAAGLGADWTMAAIVGAAGVSATLAAIRQGKTVALANKESLVCAGDFMMAAVREYGATLLPVDSEHNAVFQVFDPARRGIRRIILTASGGPFLRRTRADLAGITPAEAIRHPTWAMGAKISVDSATMMNKSLEIIEAAYLFDLSSEQIDVLIHPQSTVHSMVEYIDGSVLAQLGAPDMRTPIAHTLAFPDRMKTTGAALDLTKNMNLSFEPIDTNRFIAVNLARAALKSGGGAPTILNAANEVAVAAFLDGKLGFDRIEAIAAETLARLTPPAPAGIDDIFLIDEDARRIASAAVAGV